MQASCNAFITPTLMQLLCNAFVYSLIFVIMRYIHILCIANCLRWKSCAVFVNRSVMRNFSSELVIMPLCNTQDYHATACKYFPVNYSLFFNCKTFPPWMICNIRYCSWSSLCGVFVYYKLLLLYTHDLKIEYIH